MVIGESCLGRVHSPDTHLTVKKTTILSGGRPSLFVPCPNTFETREVVAVQTSPEFKITTDVFERDKDDDKPGMSQEDHDFLELMGLSRAPLLFREGRPRLPNNKRQAVKRAKTLSTNLHRDPEKKEHFVAFMKGTIDAGHAEPALPLKPDEERWYLPIFGVYHPKKPGKIRVVFDAAARHEGVSLNDVLMSGPDCTNSLLAIHLRFCRESVAVMADIQQMFYTFGVDKGHRNFLQFLWFRNNNPEEPLMEYRMNVHVFGNSSSPAVATYGLRKTATEGRDEFGTDVEDFVIHNFYVDDGLTSFPTNQEAASLIKRTQKALQQVGKMRLHKIASNSKEVLNAFSKADLTADLHDVDLSENTDLAPTQRSLGVSWDLHADAFTFKLNPEVKPNTRRGVLSTVNSIFDPLGFLAPVTIAGKLLLRDLVSRTTDWDSPIPEDMLMQWQAWKESLTAIEQLRLPRTYSSLQNASQELHVFADASEMSIAAVAYMRSIEGEECQVSIVLGKAKVAPKHATSIPHTFTRPIVEVVVLVEK